MHDIIFLCVIVADSTCDITIDPDNADQYIVWGIGGLGETAFKHFDRAEGRFYSSVNIVVVEESYMWSVVITVVGMWEFYSNCWQRTHNVLYFENMCFNLYGFTHLQLMMIQYTWVGQPKISVAVSSWFVVAVCHLKMRVL